MKITKFQSALIDIGFIGLLTGMCIAGILWIMPLGMIYGK